MTARRCERGFSLPEILIAITVFGFVAGGLSTMVLMNMNWNRISKEMTTATDVAQDKIEGLRNALAQPTASNDSVTRDGTTYNRTWTVVTGTGSNGIPSGTSEVAVTVSWREPEAQTITLRTYVAY
jgi:prepilin-type N-terminal cleavage/methylation domain-containing protein